MYIDTIGIILTIILVSLRYWLIVLSICASELILSFLLCLALKLNVVEVIAGGIFISLYLKKKIIFN